MAKQPPRTDDGLSAMAAQFVSAAAANLGTVGLTAAHMADLTAALADFDAKLADNYAQQLRALATTAAKNESRRALLEAMRPMIRIVRGHPVPNALLDQLGIGAIDTWTPAHSDQPLHLVATPHANGVNVLRWEPGANKAGTLYVVEVANAHTHGWQYLATSSKLSYKHAEQRPGFLQSYRVTALRRGRLSVPSFPATVYGPLTSGEQAQLAA